MKMKVRRTWTLERSSPPVCFLVRISFSSFELLIVSAKDIKNATFEPGISNFIFRRFFASKCSWFWSLDQLDDYQYFQKKSWRKSPTFIETGGRPTGSLTFPSFFPLANFIFYCFPRTSIFSQLFQKYRSLHGFTLSFQSTRCRIYWFFQIFIVFSCFGEFLKWFSQFSIRKLFFSYAKGKERNLYLWETRERREDLWQRIAIQKIDRYAMHFQHFLVLHFLARISYFSEKIVNSMLIFLKCGVSWPDGIFSLPSWSCRN